MAQNTDSITKLTRRKAKRVCSAIRYQNTA